jgi:hypothetical protein
MSAATFTPRNRLQPLATVLTWVFWFAVLATGLRVILALLGQHPWFVMRISAGMRADLEGTV